MDFTDNAGTRGEKEIQPSKEVPNAPEGSGDVAKDAMVESNQVRHF